MAIQVDGLSSGLQTTALIEAILATSTIPRDSVVADLGDTESQLGHFTDLASLMTDLKSAMENIDEETELASRTATESNAFSANLDSTAETRNHRIAVDALARESVVASQGFADKDAIGTLATGTYQITVGTTTTDVVIDDTNNSLQDFSDALNELDGVDSYVVTNGGEFQLVVRGADTGLENAVSISDTGLDATNGKTAPTFTTAQAAQDASLTIDGIAITSASNEVENAIPGVTLTLTQETSTEELLSVAPDHTSTIEKIQAFVDAYNTVQTKIDAQSVFDQDLSIRGAFVGEGSIRRMQRSMRSFLSGSYGEGTLSSLSQVGISSDNNGKLELDASALEEALKDNHSDVVSLFTGEDGLAAQAASTLDVIVDPLDGTIQSKVDSLNGQISDLEDQIDDWDVRIGRQEELLRSQFNSMEATIGKLNSVASLVSAFFAEDE